MGVCDSASFYMRSDVHWSRFRFDFVFFVQFDSLVSFSVVLFPGIVSNWRRFFSVALKSFFLWFRFR